MKPHSILFQEGYFFIHGEFQLCDLKVQEGIITEISPHLTSSKTDFIVNLKGLFVLPGLINAHDHLEFNLFPKLGNPPYRNYVEWTHDVRSNFEHIAQEVLKVPLKFRLLWGAYKNIFSGVTTVLHHNDFYRHFYFNFPVEVFKNYRWAHSLELDPDLLKKIRTLNGKPFVVHLAEGTDELAQHELSKLYQIGGLTQHTILIHGIGLTDNDIKLIVNAKSGLVWCPSSNYFLFGKTAPIEKLLGRVPVALGTDSAISGGTSLFDEIRLAKSLKNLEAVKLIEMVTSIPAAMLNINKGTINVGASAEFLVFNPNSSTPIDSILYLAPSKINCLVKNGFPLYGDVSFTNYFKISRKPYYRIIVDSKEKLISGNLPQVISIIKRFFPSYSVKNLGVKELIL